MYNNRRTKNNKIVKNAQDYIIPVIIWIFFLVILFNFFSWSDDKTSKKNKTNISENKQDWINIKFKIPNTKALITNEKWKKEEIKDSSIVNFWQIITVDKWILSFSKKWKIEWILNWRTKVEINKNNNFKLFYWDLFLKPKTNTKIEMTFWTIDLDDEAIISLEQNDNVSSIYILDWYASITTKTKKNVIIKKWKKISILSNQIQDKNLDLKSKIVDIDKIFLDDTWCEVIDYKNIIKKKKKNTKKNNKKKKKSIKLKKWKKFIKIVSIEDWMESFDKKIKIEWNILSPNVSDITINNKPTNINLNLKTFSLDFELKNKINDIIYKVFDNSWDVIWRWVITIYYTWDIKWAKNNNSNKPQTINFPENNDYKIELPWESPYTTLKTVETIKWRVPAWKVSKIQVNNFTLTKFKPWATFWWYHANMIHWNMKEWTNEYRIKYFWNNWEKLYEQVYFIIKK